MTRARRRRTAACLVSGLLTALCLVPTAAAAVEPEPDGDPLEVTIDRIGPSAIPASGRITLAGTVTNTSASAWSDLQVYPLSSYDPFTTSAELTDAAAADPSAYYGTRRTEFLVDLGDLAPGQSVRYRVRLPRSALLISGRPGVYWLGVQVLGAEEGVRADGADGRARVLVPLMRKRNPPTTSLALMLQFRARISYDEHGKVVAPGTWHRALGDRGRFGRLVELSRSSGSFPLTWVLDPALVDLARDLALDNPGFEIAPAQDGDASPSASPSAPSDGQEAPRSPEADAVKQWLSRFTAEAAAREVLALPYGDLDVAGAYLSTFGSMVPQALTASAASLASVDISSTPVVDPPDGGLPWAAVNGLDARTPVVLSQESVASRGPRVDVPNGPRLTLTDDAVTGRGGTASVPSGPLALRQRILAEAAVHALSGGRDTPLVVQLPHRWDPGRGWRRADFFGGFDVPWLIATSAASLVRSGTAEQTIEPDSDDLTYPEAAPSIPRDNFSSTLDLITAGHTLDVLLPQDDTIEPALTRLAYLGASSQLRSVSDRAQRRTDGLVRSVRALLGKVTVTGPTFVTMSSEDGPFQVIIANGLDQPVTVGVRARAIGTTRITIPPYEPLTIPGGQRRSVRMHANSSRIGVWPVTVQPVNAEGTALGQSTQFKLRSSHVGQYIWGALGIGTLVLVIAIVFRVRRQVKARQATHGPLLEQAQP